jgi:hypothetical protein
MVSVIEAFPMGRRIDDKPVTSICIVVGSPRMKTVVYKTVAAHIRQKTVIGQAIKDIGLRDVFPKKHLGEAQALARKGRTLKEEGKIAGYKVSAMGNGAIPVLYVRSAGRGIGDRPMPWRVYQEDVTRDQPSGD